MAPTKKGSNTPSAQQVLRNILDTGERLPCLVDRSTWVPRRVALRWALSRRWHVQSETLVSELAE